jgi:crotonobetainyl-CoA:carnitine CoA-transferase CaiB-like acyl-CoA transferase
MDFSDSDIPALTGIRVVTMAPNIPGPVAAARLHALGAHLTKIEAPGGDPFAKTSPAWYGVLHRGFEIATVDLKTPDGRAALDGYLSEADVLLTSSRPSALARLGLDWPDLHARHPKVVHVAIVGELPPNAERAGHDLTYVAQLGLVEPPAMPRTLLADLAGAERAVSATLALLLKRARGGGIARAYVSLREAARVFGLPRAHGLTAKGGVLGGGFSGYGVYRASDGWVAVAALEPHFTARLNERLGAPDGDPETIAARFADGSVGYWEAWAAEYDLPVIGVVEA